MSSVKMESSVKESKLGPTPGLAESEFYRVNLPTATFPACLLAILCGFHGESASVRKLLFLYPPG
jgi:hypothetical protein